MRPVRRISAWVPVLTGLGLLVLASRMGVVAFVLVFTFPGQGSQRAGMGEPWVDHPSWEVVEEASLAADRDLSGLLLSAPIEELTQTENAQLATTVLSHSRSAA